MKKTHLFRRLSLGSSALLLAVSATLPSVLGQIASALPVGQQVTSRSIKLSTSAVGATSTSYNVSFTAATSHTIRGLIVDICDGSDTPIIGDTNCAAPAGFTWGAGTPTVTLTSGLSGGTWVSTATTLNSGRTLKLTDTIGNALTGGSSVVNFTVSSVTNPTDTNDGTAGVQAGTFYARIITYTATSGDIASYTPATPGSTDATDYGGVALSLASSLTVTAKVQESLTFCVWTNPAGTICGGANADGTDVVLGDSNGVLASNTTNYVDTAEMGIASNASGGVTVRIKGNNLCRNATPANCEDADDANIIEPITTSGTMVSVADSAVAATEQFGLRVSSAATTTPTAPFNGSAGNHGFDTNASNGTTSPYGATLVTTAGPTLELNPELEFMAKSATTSEAGIYTTSINLIATGTY